MIRDETFTLLLLSQGVLLPSLSWSILGSQGQPSAFTAPGVSEDGLPSLFTDTAVSHDLGHSACPGFVTNLCLDSRKQWQ